MVKILSMIFIKDYRNYSNTEVRYRYGILCSILAIILNIFLGIVKFFVGTLTGSISITADAVNNFTDAISSALTFLGFKLSAKKPDSEHPFGHGRMEYVTAIVISGLIIFVGLESLKESVIGVIEQVKYYISPETYPTPATMEFSYVAIFILVISILVKIYMALFMKDIGKKIDSSVMKATGADAMGDTIGTSLALICMLIFKFTGLNLDAYAGLIVSAFIIKAGIESVKETLQKILGTTADPQLVEKIKKTVFQYPEVLGIHDMIVHDYGPGRFMVSLHAEFDGNRDIYLLHDITDRIEDELSKKFSCVAVVHLDPIDISDENLASAKEFIKNVVFNISEKLTVHDIRLVPGVTHTNIIFDIVVPLDFHIKNDELVKMINENVKSERPDCNCVIQIDKPYV